MRTAYKCRAYPDPEQAAQLGRTFGCVRLVWNKTLAERHTAYHQRGEKTSYKQTDQALTGWKKTQELAFRIKDGQLFLAKHQRPLEVAWSWDNVDLAALAATTVIVSREADGRWYATFAVGTTDPAPAPESGAEVGIDLGVKDFAILSTGEKTANPRRLERKARNLKRYQRRVARKQRGSNNRRRAKRKVAAAYRKVRHARADFPHKTTTRLVREHDLIAIEDLNVRGMTSSARGTVQVPGRRVRQKAGLNRAVLDAGLGEFCRQLEYKAARAGRTLVVVDRWFPSSKTCSACGYLLDRLSLGTRSWTCPSCR